MYLFPVNYYSKKSSNCSLKQNNNTNFGGKGSEIKAIAISSGLIMPTIPLTYKHSLSTTSIDSGETPYCPNIPEEQTSSDNTKEVKIFKQEDEIPPEHHPDFYKIQNEGFGILDSSYFRRGGAYGSPSDKYIDVINALKSVFQPGLFSYFKEYEKVKMFVGGIGESQEPFSLLATIKNLIGREQLNDILDMYTVDLQGQPSKSTLFKQSYYDWGTPKYVKSSFVKDEAVEIKNGLEIPKEYRVKDDIFEYLFGVYSNPEKAKWKTRIQDALKEYPEREFDIISINNTLIYVNDPVELKESVKNIYRTLKHGGIFISDNRLEIYDEIFTPENSFEIYPGIYRKK